MKVTDTTGRENAVVEQQPRGTKTGDRTRQIPSIPVIGEGIVPLTQVDVPDNQAMIVEIVITIIGEYSHPCNAICRHYGAVVRKLVLSTAGQPHTNTFYTTVDDLIFAAYQEIRTAVQNRAELAAVIERLDRDGIAVGQAAQSSPYAAGRSLQASYLDFSPAGTFTICWLSPCNSQPRAPARGNSISGLFLKNR